MKTYGLIGFPLSHSFSQKYFTEKFRNERIMDAVFQNFPMKNIAHLPELVKTLPALCGLSVTIPHKEKVMPFLDSLDESASAIGAVNCIRIDSESRKMSGYNTDHEGFTGSLRPLLKPHHTQALVLGTGGAAKAVIYSLDKLKIKFKLVSRIKSDSAQGDRPVETYTGLDEKKIKEHTLIINTTPLGMYPNVGQYPEIPYENLTSAHLLYDLTYNPEESLFLKKGRERGAATKNGLEMLHLQAEKAWKLWTS